MSDYKTNEQLLEIAIGKNAVKSYESALAGLGQAIKELAKFFNKKDAKKIQAFKELFERYCYSSAKGSSFIARSSSAVMQWLFARLKDCDYEVFGVVYLDNQNAIIEMEDMFRGTINQASVFPREVAKRALELNAAGVIYYHNHPSGVAEPSAADRQITKTLKDALNLIDIRSLDHIIIGAGNFYSFADEGLI